MSLCRIRTILDGVPLLSFDDFCRTDGQDLTKLDDDYNSDQIYLRESHINYLHYLCMLGRINTIQRYLETVNQVYGDEIDWLLNDTSLYHCWYETPLATATNWNNNPDLAGYLISQGADPNIRDYYGFIPGKETMDSWFISPYLLGCELDNFTNGCDPDNSLDRTHSDFAQVNDYLANITNDDNVTTSDNNQ